MWPKREKHFNFTTGSSLSFDKEKFNEKWSGPEHWHATAERLQDRGVTNEILEKIWFNATEIIICFSYATASIISFEIQHQEGNYSKSLLF